MFFVGFFEGAPAFRRGLLPLAVAWGCMGFGLLWVMQIHMSWVVLPVYVLAAAVGLLTKNDSGNRFREPIPGVVFIAGAAIPGCLLLPTLTRYGIRAVGLTGALAFQWQSPFGFLSTAARVLSFASFELWRFLGLTRADRVIAIWHQPWIAPFALIVLAAGVAQPIWMVATMFRRAPDGAGDWRNVRILVVATVVLIYFSYFWSIREQQAHAFYLVFPISAFAAISCWDLTSRAAGERMRRWERLAIGVFISSLVVHAGLAIDRGPRQSLYVDRAVVAAAITDRNDRYLGDRRDTIYAKEDHRPRAIDPVKDAAAFLAASAVDDLQIRHVSWTPVRDLASVFSVTIEHRGAVAAWLDLRYVRYVSGRRRPRDREPRGRDQAHHPARRVQNLGRGGRQRAGHCEDSDRDADIGRAGHPDIGSTGAIGRVLISVRGQTLQEAAILI